MQNFNFINNLGSSDMESYILVLNEYRKYCFSEHIESVGFNENSGYVYIYLQNGISIASCFGQSVDYIINDPETEEEIFLDTYEEAKEYLNK